MDFILFYKLEILIYKNNVNKRPAQPVGSVRVMWFSVLFLLTCTRDSGKLIFSATSSRMKMSG